MLGFSVDCFWFEIGRSDFLHAFFSNIAYHLEQRKWGSRFPIIMNEFYQGSLDYRKADLALNELETIQRELRNFNSKQVIWDIEDLSLTPPWRDNISDDITDLSNYFITCNGEDFIDIFKKALKLSKNEKVDLTIEDL